MHSTSLLTCVSCRVAFQTSIKQKEHYQSDWHSYNLKRKRKSKVNYNFKIKAQRKKETPDLEQDFSCSDCNLKTLETHNNSKKHLEQLKQQKAPNNLNLEESIKYKEIGPLTLEECIFCTKISQTFEENLDHMISVHNFFVPEKEFLTDLKGLIQYLSDKVSTAFICIYCNGRGKELKSLDSVRKHMCDKGHCKIAYEDEYDQMDISDFYDFSATYNGLQSNIGAVEDDGDEEFMDIDSDEDIDTTLARPKLSQSNLELILPNGSIVGHRDLKQYYKQNLPLREIQSPELIKLIKAEEKKKEKNNQLVKDSFSRKGVSIDHQSFNHFHQFQTRVGIKANKLQRHFREQLLQ